MNIYQIKLFVKKLTASRSSGRWADAKLALKVSTDQGWGAQGLELGM